jgi:catabolite regulation protein CreA
MYEKKLQNYLDANIDEPVVTGVTPYLSYAKIVTNNNSFPTLG